MATHIEARIYNTLTTGFTGSPSLLSPVNIFPLLAKQDCDPPFITYEILTDTPMLSLDGPNSLRNATCDVNVITTSYLESKEITNAVALAMYDTPSSEFRIGSYSIGEDAWEMETGLFILTSSFSLWYYRDINLT